MDAFLNLNELSESSIKTYNASYNKLTDLLGQPIEESNPRNIIRKINTVTNPNSQKGSDSYTTKDVPRGQSLPRNVSTPEEEDSWVQG